MTGGFEVDSQSLRVHARAVDDTADAMEECRRAASSIALGRDAYGRLCQLIPSLLHPIQEATIDSLGETVRALQEAADGLRTVSDRYERGDERAASRFGGGTR
ncbi:type VII secretion target [Micromonospora sp. NPDC049274]|uniref:type VII secretion target n=1 Tax=Micromonospora sp. NPDC049274 TaxID=3154829 RepID=UPI0034400BA0